MTDRLQLDDAAIIARLKESNNNLYGWIEWLDRIDDYKADYSYTMIRLIWLDGLITGLTEALPKRDA